MARKAKSGKSTSPGVGKKPPANSGLFRSHRVRWALLAVGIVGIALWVLPVPGVGVHLGPVSLTGALAPEAARPRGISAHLVGYQFGHRSRNGSREWRVRLRDRVWMVRVG